jgi:arabinose-5-phosphate isomerase
MLTEEQILQSARNTITQESEALLQMEKSLNHSFAQVVSHILKSKGRVVVTGVGKSAIIAQKISATFNSTGTPSLFMHAADAVHGDLGMIQSDDVVIILSKSGNTPEIKVLLPLLKRAANTLVALVGNDTSYLAKQADWVLDCSSEKEACPHNLAPTTSTTLQLVMGDAMAVALLEARGFKVEDFAKFHPGGILGKQLYLKVSDIMSDQKPYVERNTGLKELISSITSGRLGATAVIESDQLAGVITDGDLRRLIEKDLNLKEIRAEQLMNSKPSCIDSNALAAEALEIMRSKQISQLVVLTNGIYSGMIHIHDLNREGII